MKVSHTLSALCALLGCVSVHSMAEEVAGVPVGNMFFYPEIQVGVGHNDNISLLPALEIDSGFSQIKPELLLEGEGNKTRAQVGYEGDWVWYGDASRFDYQNHRFFGIAEFKVDARWLATGEAQYLWGHDEPGSTDRGRNLNPDEWKAWGVGGKVRYGADGAKGRLEGEISYFDKDFTNNRVDTIAYDREDTNGRGTFFWRVGGRTDAIFELIYQDLDYKLSSSLQDNRVTTVNGGVEWEATGKTSGAVRVGYTEKDFRSSLGPDQNIFSWDIGVTWKPRTYSTFDFSSLRTVEDATGQGTSIDRTAVRVDWEHFWRDRFSTTTSLELQNRDYNTALREDDFLLFKLQADYEFRRWLTLGASYRYRENDSNQDISDYKQNVFLLEVTASF